VVLIFLFVQIVLHKISPGIYSLLSNTFSGSEVGSLDAHDRADRQVYISRLTKCWADCACVVVVDHRLRVSWWMPAVLV
jgi:hypothetical protein